MPPHQRTLLKRIQIGEKRHLAVWKALEHHFLEKIDQKSEDMMLCRRYQADVEDLANIGDTNQAICDRDDDRAIHLDDTGMEKNNCLFTVPPNTTTRKKGKEKTAPKSSLVQSGSQLG